MVVIELVPVGGNVFYRVPGMVRKLHPLVAQPPFSANARTGPELAICHPGHRLQTAGCLHWPPRQQAD